MFQVTFFRIHPKMRMHRAYGGQCSHDHQIGTQTDMSTNFTRQRRASYESPESVRILRQRCWMVSIATLNQGNLISSCTMTCPHQLTQRIETFWRIMLKAVSFPLLWNENGWDPVLIPLIEWETKEDHSTQIFRFQNGDLVRCTMFAGFRKLLAPHVR